MIKLNYLYIELPKKVRLISEAMGMNHYIEPETAFGFYDPYEDAPLAYTMGIGIDELFKLSETELFDHIFVYLDKDNIAFYYDERNERHNIEGWVDLIQFEKGSNH